MNIKEFKVGEKAWVYYTHRGTEVITETEIVSVGRKIVIAHNGYGIEIKYRNPNTNEKNQFWLVGEVGGYIESMLFKNYADILTYKQMITLRKQLLYECVYPTSSKMNALTFEDLKTVKSIFDKYN